MDAESEELIRELDYQLQVLRARIAKRDVLLNEILHGIALSPALREAIEGVLEA